MTQETLPHAPVAEESLLGCILLDKDSISKVVGMIGPKDFFLDYHRSVYEAIISLYEAAQPIDMTTVATKLHSTGKLNSIGGPEYLAEMQNSVPVSTHIMNYAKIVKHRSMLRNIIKLGAEMKKRGENEEAVPSEILHWTNKATSYLLGRISADEDNKEDHFDSTLDCLDESSAPFTWGTVESDKKFSPIQDHSYIFLAGEQSSGKTAFSFDMACKNALIGKKVLYISLEMNASEIVKRVCRTSAAITKEQWRDKRLISDRQKEAYKKEHKRLQSLETLDLFGFNQGETKTSSDLVRIIKNKQPDLVFIDNFDLIDQMKGMDQLRHERHTSKVFMDFCKEENTPVIMVHHMNKSKETVDIKSMRGSGKLTDDATGVFICKRNMNPEDQGDAVSKAKFNVYEVKDREFGANSFHQYFFHKGTFVDDLNHAITRDKAFAQFDKDMDGFEFEG